MRRSNRFLTILGFLAILFILMIAHAGLGRRDGGKDALEKRDLVRALGLTDLCLATEANYTRHASQTDFSAPFQDHPGALEHFPSGTWLRPNLSSGYGYGQLGRTTKEHP
jgi:hypothetical protein